MPVKSCYHPFSNVFCFLFMLNISIFMSKLGFNRRTIGGRFVLLCVVLIQQWWKSSTRTEWIDYLMGVCVFFQYTMNHGPWAHSVKRNVTQFTAWMRNYIEWLWTFITPCAAHVIRIKLLKYCLYDSVMWFIAMNKSGHTIENCSKVARTSSIIIDSQICTISMIPVLRWLADSKVRWLQIIHG